MGLARNSTGGGEELGRVDCGERAWMAEFLRIASLMVLVVQNMTLALAMRYSRTENTGQDLYLVTTAVVTAEVLKLLGSGLLASWTLTPSELASSVFSMEAAPMLVPAGLYTLQNTLLFVAASHLDVHVMQVLIQLKMVTTALFGMVILRRRLSVSQWLGILACALGVAVVQLSFVDDHGDEDRGVNDRSRMIGLVAVAVQCTTSGFASAYTEKLFKSGKTSMWVRNMHLAMFSIALGTGSVVVNDGSAVLERGFFVGYTPAVWFVIVVQAIGGLVVAVVIKYADTVAKGFSTGLSIVLTAAVSAVLFDFQATPLYVCGASCVILSIYLYGRSSGAPAPQAGPTLSTAPISPAMFGSVIGESASPRSPRSPRKLAGEAGSLQDLGARSRSTGSLATAGTGSQPLAFRDEQDRADAEREMLLLA